MKIESEKEYKTVLKYLSEIEEKGIASVHTNAEMVLITEKSLAKYEVRLFEQIGKVRCKNCGHTWIAISPSGVPRLKCSECGSWTTVKQPKKGEK